MAILVPDVGEVLFLSTILAPTVAANQEGWNLRLFSNNITPAETDTAATYVEATFAGYAAKALTRTIAAGTWSTPATTAGTTKSTYNAGAPQTWNATSAQTVYGYYWTGATSGTLYLAELFPSAIALVNPSTLTLTPSLEAA